MMTEMEKWHELYDDEEYIKLLIQEGETPESSSGMSTADIERERDLRLHRAENWKSYDNREAVVILGAGMAVIAAGYAGYRLIKKGCQKVKEVIKKRKLKKEEET